MVFILSKLALVRLGWVKAQFWRFWLKGGVNMVNLWLRIGTKNKACFGPVISTCPRIFGEILKVLTWIGSLISKLKTINSLN